MKTPFSRGFTIIEVMLFLAVSGVMVAGLLGGWTLLVNTQRYKDTIDTVYGYMQDQYNLVYNVENERKSTLTCTSTGEINEDSASQPRGQSDCVLMGRMIKLVDGKTFESYAVLGTKPAADAAGDDNAVIKSYRPKTITQSIGLTESHQSIPWEAEAVGKEGAGDGLNVNIILLRSPTSGIVHRYVVAASATNTSINDSDIAVANESEDFTMCFNPGALVSGVRQAVVIRAYASSRNSVETLADNNGC
mgnify:FL=1